MNNLVYFDFSKPYNLSLSPIFFLRIKVQTQRISHWQKKLPCFVPNKFYAEVGSLFLFRLWTSASASASQKFILSFGFGFAYQKFSLSFRFHMSFQALILWKNISKLNLVLKFFETCHFVCVRFYCSKKVIFYIVCMFTQLK